jgi:hypothetical protein
MDPADVLPPGKDPRDPYKSDIDAVGFALDRLWTMLLWASEHRASFLAYRESDPAAAEVELAYLANVIEQGWMHVGRLSELILAGYTVDPNKRLPKDLQRRLAKREALPAFDLNCEHTS